jgi:hypothetical protein
MESREWPGRRWSSLVLLVLVVQFVVLALYEARQDGLTVDEPIYLASGLAAITEAEHRINCEAPVVPKALNAIPLWFAGIEVPLDGVWADVRSCDVDGLPSDRFAAELTERLADRGELRDAAFLGRLVPVAESVLTGLGLYVLATALAGRAAGLVAAAAWLTTPLVVGLGHLNSLDVAFTLAVVWAAVALERYVRAPTDARLGCLAVASGGLLLTRHTGVLVIGAALVGVGFTRWGQPRLVVRDVLVVLVGAWALVWGATAIVTPESLTGPMATDPYAPTPGTGTRAALAFVDALPLPASYEAGLRFQLVHAETESPGFLFGSTWRGARWWYWPASALVKLPVPALGLIVLGLLGSWGLPAEHRRRAALAVSLPATTLVLFLLPFPKPVGVRYLLPALALLLALGAARAVSLPARVPKARRWLGALGGVALVVQLASQWDAAPHSIAWTAPPFRPGYAVVSESSIDWGQDGTRLAAWMQDREVAVAYFGGERELMQLEGLRQLVALEPADVRGWVAASVSLLTSYEREHLAWLRGYCHVGDIGGSILLYRFEEAPSAAPGPSAPAGRCSPGTTSSRR